MIGLVNDPIHGGSQKLTCLMLFLLFCWQVKCLALLVIINGRTRQQMRMECGG